MTRRASKIARSLRSLTLVGPLGEAGEIVGDLFLLFRTEIALRETAILALVPDERTLGHSLTALSRVFGPKQCPVGISAPLMEHYLIREAQSLIEQVSAWEDLQGYPALEHSVHLRRLALGAFSGRWVQDDLHLLSHDGERMGRAEDWLQFWFHMSLAARRLKEFASAEAFLQKARAVVERIAAGLQADQAESFLRRPDIARIWRLSAPHDAVSPKDQKVRARRQLPGSGPAEVASLAPPTSNKSEK